MGVQHVRVAYYAHWVKQTGIPFNIIFSIMLLICRYVGSGGETGMATMEVKMVSGYVPHEQSLNRFQDGNSIGLKRFDKYKPGQPLSLYFDKVSLVKPAVATTCIERPPTYKGCLHQLEIAK